MRGLISLARGTIAKVPVVGFSTNTIVDKVGCVSETIGRIVGKVSNGDWQLKVELEDSVVASVYGAV